MLPAERNIPESSVGRRWESEQLLGEASQEDYSKTTTKNIRGQKSQCSSEGPCDD